MKNKFRVLAMAFMTLFITVGCSSESPSDVVNNYFTEIKKGMNENMSQLFTDSLQEENTSENEEVSPEMTEAMKVYVSKIDAKVLSESIEGDKANVKVELSSINIGKVMMEVLEDNISKMFEVQENMSENLDADLLEKIKSASVEKREGSVNLVKSDNTWTIEQDDDLTKLLFGSVE